MRACGRVNEDELLEGYGRYEVRTWRHEEDDVRVRE